jgi:REP element-mobilizing transposase RayT
VTKNRHWVFSDWHLARMEEVMRAVCADFECELVEFHGETNHVHLLVDFPPKVAISKLVNSIEGVSSRRLRQEFPDLVRPLLARPAAGVRTGAAVPWGRRRWDVLRRGPLQPARRA